MRRYTKPANPLSYLESAGEGRALEDSLAAADLGFEFMLNALRLIDGFPAQLVAERIGEEPPGLRDRLAQARHDGLLEANESRLIRPTADGFRFLNDLQARFLP